jgi:hypothetical protein
MVQIGLQGGTFGFNLGLGLNELMMIAVGVTLLFILVLPIGQNGQTYNFLGVPGATVTAFNTLWFSNFEFFNSNQTSCAASVGSFNDVWYYFKEPNSAYSPGSGAGGGGGGARSGNETATYNSTYTQLSGIPEVIGSITGSISNSFGSILLTLVKLLLFIWDVGIGCGVNGVRLIIGFGVAVTIFYPISLVLFNLLKLIW